VSEQGFPRLVPFLKIIGDADPYGFTPGGKMVIWRYETPEEPEEVTGGFSEVLTREIRSLEQRKERQVQEAR
jgi:hypothetical protein